MKIEIKRRYTGEVLWSGKAVDLRDGLQQAVKAGADLAWADLAGSNLAGSNLAGSNLARSNLKDACLTGCDLAGADLTEADLTGACLTGACLTGSNLAGANLYGAKPGSICRMDFGGWSICIREDKTSIGCQSHPNTDWLKWTPKDVAGFDKDASAWWKLHGQAVKATIKVVMAKAKQEAK